MRVLSPEHPGSGSADLPRRPPLAVAVPLVALALSVVMAYALGARFAVVAGVLAAGALAVGAARSRLARAALALALCPLPAAALWAHRRDEGLARPVERALALEVEADRRFASARTAADDAAAIAAYEQAVEAWPSFVGCYKLGAARWRAGDRGGALTSFQQALAAGDAPLAGPRALYEGGIALLLAGQVDLGLLALEEGSRRSVPVDGLR